jgi:nephrocystin-3
MSAWISGDDSKYLQREIRVFLSSTFKDMNKERNYLVKHVFPEVRQKCSERGVGFTEIDLRWGITEEAAKSGETTAICLREIDRCRDFPPFFIGFLGERYGWIPKEKDIAEYLGSRLDDEYYRAIADGLHQGISVTELEIQHGVLSSDAEGIFYFRDPALTEKIYSISAVKDKKDFYDAPGELLERLKEEIRLSESGKLKLDGYTSVEQFGDDVKAELLNALEMRYPEGDLSPLEQLLLPQKIFARSRLQAYIPLHSGRKEFLEYCQRRQLGEEKRNLLITAESGQGKSAFMADLARFVPQELGGDSVKVVDLYAGVEGCSSLTQWRGTVQSILGLSSDGQSGVPTLDMDAVDARDEDRQWIQFAEMLQSWCSDHLGQTLVLLLDAVNQLVDGDSALQRLQGLSWPKDCLCVVSATPQKNVSSLWCAYPLQSLTEVQREMLINDYCDGYSKKLPQVNVQALATHEACQNPLYLKVVLEQLRTYFTSHSLENDIEKWLSCGDLITLFTEVIVQLNDEMSDEAHPNLISDLCGYLAASRAGFDENQLSILLAAESDFCDEDGIGRLSRLKLSSILAVLNPMILRSQGRESLMHASFVQAALKNSDEKCVRQRIIQCFDGDVAQAVSERCYQYTQLAKLTPGVDEYKEELVQLLGSIRDASKVLGVDKGVLQESLLLLGARQEGLWTRNLIQRWGAVPDADFESEGERFVGFFRNQYFPILGIFLLGTLVALLRQKARRVDSTTLAVYLINLSDLYVWQNQPGKALPLYTEALEICRTSLPAGHPDIASCLNNLAHLYHSQNQPDMALPLYVEALEINRTSLPAGHPNIAISLNNLASLYESQNQPDMALPLYTEALEIDRAILPAGHPGIANILNNLANFYRVQNQPDKALPLYKEALEINRASLPADHPNIAMSLTGLASLYDRQNQPDMALPLYTEALEICRASLPADHSNIAMSLTGLASLYDRQNQPDMALPLYMEALEINRAGLPAGHSDIAISLNNLALFYKEQNQPDKALLLYVEALEIRRASLPASHPDIASSLSNLASLYESQNQPDMALPLYTEALEIRRASLPAGHPDIANSLNNLAGLYRSQNQPDKALPLYTEALEICRTSLPAGHPDIASCLNGLAGLYRDQNQPDKALPLYVEALEIDRTSLPAGHPDIANSLSNLAGLYRSQNQPDKALPLHVEALEIRRTSLPAGHPTIASSLGNLAVLYHSQNQSDKALPLYVEALEISRASLPAGHPNIAISLNNLAALYQDLNQSDKALPLYVEALEISRVSLPAGHPDIASSLGNLAVLYHSQNQSDKALPLYVEALEICRTSLPAGHPGITSSLSNLASLYESQNHPDMALPLYTEALEICRTSLPAGHPNIATSLHNLAEFYANQNQSDKALPLFTEALEIRRASLPPDHPVIAVIVKKIAKYL